jgi:1,4-dihydroxy-6-naphthoate synthase
MKLSLGFSPCPNDTFIFDALVNRKIPTGSIAWDPVLADVETLNQWALTGRLDISKISYGVLPLALPSYRLLDAGGALGKSVGPLLVARQEIAPENIPACRVAIPGLHTTAHLLFALAFPTAMNKQFMVFSAIEDAVLAGKADCGVIIHEGRFTYRQKGLVCLADLGTFWESRTGGPIPLGGIVMRRTLDAGLAEELNDSIRRSLDYSFSRYPVLSSYVKEHSREMDEQVMRQHIELYVNDYSRSLGPDGARAVNTLLETYTRLFPQTLEVSGAISSGL